MSNNCYMTLATDEKYLPCIKRCNFSMKYYKNQYPYIVLVSKNNLDIQQKLKDEGIEFIPIQVDKFSAQRHGLLLHEDTINKYQIFNFTEYDKICFIDADMVVRKNIDYLFDDLAEDEQTCFYSSDRGLCGEFFIVRPNPALYMQIYSTRSQYINDEEMLNEYFSTQLNKRSLPQGPLVHFAGPFKMWERSVTAFPQLKEFFLEDYTSNEQFIDFINNHEKWGGYRHLWYAHLDKMMTINLYAVLINNKEDLDKALKLEEIMTINFGIGVPFVFIINCENLGTQTLQNKNYIYANYNIPSNSTFLQSLQLVKDTIGAYHKVCFIYNLDMEVTESLDYLFSNVLSFKKRQQTLTKYQNDLFLF